jgi:hypothetical protein
MRAPAEASSLTSGRSSSRQLRLRQIRRRPAEHLVFLLQKPVTTLKLTQLREPSEVGPSLTSAVRSLFDSVIGCTPKSVAICSSVTPGPRSQATLTTSSRNSLGNGFGAATSFQPGPRPSDLRCHRSMQQTRESSMAIARAPEQSSLGRMKPSHS